MKVKNAIMQISFSLFTDFNPKFFSKFESCKIELLTKMKWKMEKNEHLLRFLLLITFELLLELLKAYHRNSHSFEYLIFQHTKNCIKNLRFFENNAY